MQFGLFSESGYRLNPSPADSYAEDLDENFQVAHSDKFFFGNTDLQAPDAKAALNDLVTKLQAQGWQQVTVGVPSPWYSFEFKKVIS